ncbi:hypothetical protein NQ317_008302 [Molorchus minor]|uniref:Uncharacterized protein n=1 Tax=Molorchus minor TaxID=1323400 RepID=A0ABQ9J0T2_9CUCU|nr:hypothetical protein NQ317_008302 [Molorchus minor]
MHVLYGVHLSQTKTSLESQYLLSVTSLRIPLFTKPATKKCPSSSIVGASVPGKNIGPVDPDSQVISTNNSSEFNKKILVSSTKSKRDLQYSGRRKLLQRLDRLQKLVMMTDTQLNGLIRKRSGLKGNLTRFSNFLDTIKNSEPNKNQLVELELLQLEIENFAEIPEASADSQELTNFESAYFSVLANAKDILNSQSCLLNNNSNLNLLRLINH